jgi:hypothetical protein
MTFEEIIKLNDSNPEVLGKIAILNISKENYRLYADNFNGTEDNEYEETLRLIGIDNYGWFLDEEIPFFKNLSETAKRQLRYGALVYTRAGDGIVDETMIYSFNFLTHIPLDVIQNLRQSADTRYLMTNELGDKDKAEAFISKSRCINISLDSDNADFAKNLELFSSLNLEDFNGKSITIHLSSLDEEINLKQIADLSDKFQSRKLEISINIIDSYNGDYDYITFDDILKNVHTDIFTMRDYLEIHNPQSMLNGIKRDRNLRIDSDDLSVSYKGQITNPLYDFKSIILHLKETHCEKLCLSEISINEISKWGTLEHSILNLDFCDFRSNEAIRNFILLFPNLKEITFEECGIEGSNVLINTNMSIFDEFRDEVIIKFIG